MNPIHERSTPSHSSQNSAYTLSESDLALATLGGLIIAANQGQVTFEAIWVYFRQPVCQKFKYAFAYHIFKEMNPHALCIRQPFTARLKQAILTDDLLAFFNCLGVSGRGDLLANS